MSTPTLFQTQVSPTQVPPTQVNLLAKISIVLVEPSHPGNIGAVARAMKTMGLLDLVLVKPKKYPHYEASKRAAGAQDVLEQARVVESLDHATAESTLVVGTSVRDREVAWPTHSPRQSATRALRHLREQQHAHVAIVFGRESSGLSNQEMDVCDWQIRIDANPDYSSLNLASAVQIVSYEMRAAWALEQSPENQPSAALSIAEQRQQSANKKQLNGHLQHLQSTLEALDFIKVSSSNVLMRKLARLYNKAQLSIEEIQILRGILSAINDKIR